MPWQRRHVSRETSGARRASLGGNPEDRPQKAGGGESAPRPIKKTRPRGSSRLRGEHGGQGDQAREERDVHGSERADGPLEEGGPGGRLRGGHPPRLEG